MIHTLSKISETEGQKKPPVPCISSTKIKVEGAEIKVIKLKAAPKSPLEINFLCKNQVITTRKILLQNFEKSVSFANSSKIGQFHEFSLAVHTNSKRRFGG